MNWVTKNVYYLLAAVILLAAIYVDNVKAETNVYLGAWSEHLLSSDDLNEQHDLIAIEHDRWIAGRFVNSYNRNTVFTARKWAWRYGDLSAGVYGGAMRGYRRCWGDDDSNADICPMIAPYVTWDARPVSPQIFLFGEALAVSVRIEL